MLRALCIAVAACALLIAGCSKEGKEPKPSAPPATLSTGTVSADGVRTIAIEAGKDGYVPDKIPGKPGEKLKLVFTRTIEGECLEELKTPDGKLVKLPMKQPYEVAVTVPESGGLTFACGMDMFRGQIVADVPATK